MDELIRELKSQGVLRSPSVEAAFRAIDRKDFVPPTLRDEAYANYPLPIGRGQTISQPYTVAFMLDLLDPRPGERILDIGAGSGWTTALLAHIVSQPQPGGSSSSLGEAAAGVVAVERIPELCAFGRANVEKYNFIRRGTAKFLCRDGSSGLPEEAPFDKILASAAASELPGAWKEQLRIGGKIVAPVGSSVRCYAKTGEREWQEQEFPGFAFVPLVGAQNAGPGDSQNRNGADEGPGESSGRLTPRTMILPALFIGSLLAWATFVPLRPPDETVSLEIPAGSGSRDIGRILKSNGLVRSKWLFVTYAAMAGSADKLKPGRYQFDAGASIPDIVDQLVAGGRFANERTITIPEGWDLRDLGRYFEAEGMFEAASFWELAGFPAADYRTNRRTLPPPRDFSGEFPFLADKPRSVGLEGYLYPDTYRVFRDASAEDVARKMLENFGRRLTPDIREEISRRGRTLFAVITVASLLEKEIVHDEDRRIASGIIWKRLEAGLPLQIDASVNYATGKRQTPSQDDLELDSPFNTYRSPGLPLGPIANPGLGTIRAALDPRESEYLYYLSTSDGKTIFSRSLEEHNAAKARHLRGRSEGRAPRHVET